MGGVVMPFLIFWLLVAALSGYVGHTKGRLVLGVVLGVLFGLIGLLVIAVIPEAKGGGDG
jgi:predicted MFS family arabinose efflux permease